MVTREWPNGMLFEHHRGMLCNQCLAGSGMGGSPNFAPKQLQYLLDLLTWGMAFRRKRETRNRDSKRSECRGILKDMEEFRH
ncbi:uncharacterized protein LOC131307284 [Rhododendron vialii]|uniref:uncharacterized protein LOC131307284 n=1 Tax=Rhododendron vialii TaxID=182163 RepID=UPI00266057E1|nr:uncharacterized protein LOC131307284 [Rhododendron vialii]